MLGAGSKRAGDELQAEAFKKLYPEQYFER